MLSEKEFIILKKINKLKSAITQRDLAEKTGYSLGTVNRILNTFFEKDYINEEYQVTLKGRNILDYYKVDNAIILAAGMTAGLNSISRNIPKGLYVVKGEILIERMIRQLQSVGIKEIYVVVGFRMDQFFYLEQKYGVHLIVNTEYATRNNNGSVYCVRELLGNSYIIPSDEYFVENVFSKYEYHSYYASIFSKGRTKETFVKLDKYDRIQNVYKGADSGWIMLGHCYMTREYSATYIKWLGDVYNRYETRKLFWEEIFYPHLKDIPLYIKKYNMGIIYEFDELNELQGFDNQFISNINPEIYKMICRIFNSTQEEITDICPLWDEKVDLWFKFKVRNDEFLYRYPNRESQDLINYTAEQIHSKIVNEIGVDGSYIYEERNGNRIEVLTVPIQTIDFNQCIQLVKKYKIEYGNLVANFDYREKIRLLVGMFDDNQLLRLSANQKFSRYMMDILTMVENDNWKKCLCHNNISTDKFKMCGNDYALVDWRFSGLNDEGYDIAGLAFSFSENEKINELIVGKFVTPTKEVIRHLYACQAIYHYYQYLLGIYFDKEENEFSNKLYYHWKRATKCANYVEELSAQRQNKYLTNIQVEYVEQKMGEKIVSVTPISGGVTNTTYMILSKSGRKIAVRIPGKGTNEYINRKDEMLNITLIDSLGIMPQVYCADSKTGVLIMEYIDNSIPCSMQDVYNPLALQRICRVLHEVHTSGRGFENEFDILKTQKKYIDHLHKLDGDSPKALKLEEKRMNIWMDYLFLNYPKELVPCHNDPKLNNFLKKGRKIYLLDWEYSGLADIYFELSNFSLTNNLKPEEEKMFLEMYCKVSDIKFDREKFLLYKFATDYLWIYWHLIKIQENEMIEYNEMSWRKRLGRAKKILDELEMEQK